MILMFITGNQEVSGTGGGGGGTHRWVDQEETVVPGIVVVRYQIGQIAADAKATRWFY